MSQPEYVGNWFVIAPVNESRRVVADIMRSKSYAEQQIKYLGLVNVEVREVRVAIDWNPFASHLTPDVFK